MTPPDVPDLRSACADLGDVRLHYVEAGDGPLVVLLHGFPEFWYGWRGQIGPLAAAGFRVMAPDLRGYNRSSKPQGVHAYAMKHLVADVRALIGERGESSALVAGHDWGGVIGYALAARHPEAVRRLAVLNAPHPRRMAHALRHKPDQLLRSSYIALFQAPWLPERAIAAGRWALLRRAMAGHAAPGAFTGEDLRRYVEAWERPGAATAMLHYYRAAFRRVRATAAAAPVTAPTWIIWGERDHALLADLAEPFPEDVPGLERVVRLPDASHWVQHDEPERVARLLIECFSATDDHGGSPP